MHMRGRRARVRRHHDAATGSDRNGRPALAMLRAASDATATTARIATAIQSRRRRCSRRLLSCGDQRRIVCVGRGGKTLLEMRELLPAHKLVDLAVGDEAETERALVVVVRAGAGRIRRRCIGTL